MNLKETSNQKVNEQLRLLFQSEKEILCDILWPVRELDTRMELSDVRL